MDTTSELTEQTRSKPDDATRSEAARARAYLDLWERHLSQSAVDAPIRPGSLRPA